MQIMNGNTIEIKKMIGIVVINLMKISVFLGYIKLRLIISKQEEHKTKNL